MPFDSTVFLPPSTELMPRRRYCAFLSLFTIITSLYFVVPVDSRMRHVIFFNVSTPPPSLPHRPPIDWPAFLFPLRLAPPPPPKPCSLFFFAATVSPPHPSKIIRIPPSRFPLSNLLPFSFLSARPLVLCSTKLRSLPLVKSALGSNQNKGLHFCPLPSPRYLRFERLSCLPCFMNLERPPFF